MERSGVGAECTIGGQEVCKERFSVEGTGKDLTSEEKAESEERREQSIQFGADTTGGREQEQGSELSAHAHLAHAPLDKFFYRLDSSGLG
jgi:hypothetical protein